LNSIHSRVRTERKKRKGRKRKLYFLNEMEKIKNRECVSANAVESTIFSLQVVFFFVQMKTNGIYISTSF
jgi:hypothetical protein